ncbi:hypothetical protein HPP92_003803 [Vanilla planifolia]|uniref:Uncharacterized protein n=1 Tax=Vanilla planifolia TaxID=51239 RepID=A0A835SCL2_VANPL|nr:hypothetical protein HPP92_003803 [Vanilla planifolia]
MADPIPPPTFRHRPLLKHLSWSPDMEREEAWERRKDLYRARRFSGRQSVRSVTEDDLDEIRGCIDLGIVFGDESAERIGEILPALDLYLSVRRDFIPSHRVAHRRRIRHPSKDLPLGTPFRSSPQISSKSAQGDIPPKYLLVATE